MKLQHLTIIFIIIMLPISLIISAYTQMQIDTLILQNQYDAKLMDATYDAIKAFDMNTTSNDISNVSDSLREDILAAISTFMTSFATNMGVGGYQEEYIKPYIPAILFTLYDGYYIYAPTLTNNGNYVYTLQPYNYYSVRYKHGNTDIVVNYSLDNYIVIYGTVNGHYEVASGYLVQDDKSTMVHSEEINECVPVATWVNGKLDKVEILERNVTQYNGIVENGGSGESLYERNESYYINPESAKQFYMDAEKFRNWIKDNKLNEIMAKDALRNNQPIKEFENDNTRIFNISDSNNNPEVSTSNFNEHRIAVIKNTIEDNLNYVITAYANASGGNTPTYSFRMPKLDASEWLTIASNICMVSFVQGMPVGSRYYNNYSIVRSTTNKLFVDPENIYYVDYNVPESERYYHKIDCPKLDGNSDKIVGFSNYNFQPFNIKVKEKNMEYNYWRHREKACYYCIVGNSYTSECGRSEETGKLLINNLKSTQKKQAYYTAVAREKYRQYKVTETFKITSDS